MSGEVTKYMFEYTVTRALRVLLLRILHQYSTLDTSVEDSTKPMFTPEIMKKLDKCGDKISPEIFTGEILHSTRIYHHGLNSVGFNRAQNLLLEFLKAKLQHIDILKLKQIITAQQRYMLRKADALCLDVYNINLETLIVLFRDFFPKTLKLLSGTDGLEFDLLDFIYEISAIHRGFFHGEFPRNLLPGILMKCSILKVNYIRSLCRSMDKTQLRFWNSYLVPYVNFVCNLDETRSNIPIHVKRKSLVAPLIFKEAPRIRKTHGSHGPRCECDEFKQCGRKCMCTSHTKRRKRHHSTDGLYSDLIDKGKSVAVALPRTLKQRRHTELYRRPSIRDLVEYECYGPDCLTNIFVNESRFSIGQVCIQCGRSTGTAVCIGKGFILSAYHVFKDLLDPCYNISVSDASVHFGKEVIKLKEDDDTFYHVLSQNEKEDWVIIEIPGLKDKDLRPLRLSMTDDKEEPEHHPEGWPLCMHAAGYSTRQLTVNERMKILHETEKEHKVDIFKDWFEAKEYPPAFSQIAATLNNRKGDRRKVFKNFLFPRDTEIFFMSGLLGGASGSPCLVFDKYNHPIVHALLLGACPKELFNYSDALRKYPERFLFRRGITARKIYEKLCKIKNPRSFKIAEHPETNTWILTS